MASMCGAKPLWDTYHLLFDKPTRGVDAIYVRLGFGSLSAHSRQTTTLILSSQLPGCNDDKIRTGCV